MPMGQVSPEDEDRFTLCVMEASIQRVLSDFQLQTLLTTKKKHTDVVIVEWGDLTHVYGTEYPSYECYDTTGTVVDVDVNAEADLLFITVDGARCGVWCILYKHSDDNERHQCLCQEPNVPESIDHPGVESEEDEINRYNALAESIYSHLSQR